MVDWRGFGAPCTFFLTATTTMLNRIPVECPACQHVLKIRAEFFGQDVACRHCDHTFPLSNRVLIPCPACGEESSVPVDWLGRWVRCPAHRHPFPAEPGHARVSVDSPTPEDGTGPTLLDIGALLRRVEELEQALRAGNLADPGSPA